MTPPHTFTVLSCPLPPFRRTRSGAQQRSQDVDMDRRRLQESLRREIDARKRIDKMLRGYKDEVTLIPSHMLPDKERNVCARNDRPSRIFVSPLLITTDSVVRPRSPM